MAIPNYREVDIEEIGRKYEEVLAREFAKPTQADCAKFTPIITQILASPAPLSDKELTQIKRKHKCNSKRSFLYQVYLELIRTNSIVPPPSPEAESILRKTLQIKPYKSWSGIVSVTIFTAAYPEYTDPTTGERKQQQFSCQYNCYMCPKEPNQPRSYLSLEPAVIRAARNNYDAVAQIRDRLHALYITGHDISKCELIVSGGTWTSYPVLYREEFCRDIYYAVNTYYDDQSTYTRPRLSLEQEKRINQTAQCRVVGLTIETRPDTITPEEIRLLRTFGVTRVQLGIQHTDDDILNLINRKCPTTKTIQGIRLLKESCFKIDAHWMLNLPGATPDTDSHMLNNTLLGLKSPIKTTAIYHPRTWLDYLSGKPKKLKEIREYYDIAAPDLATCGWKIYPCAVTPWTEIEKWFKEDKYVPYHESLMQEILITTMQKMYPWIRVARIIRDIPEFYMYNQNTGADNTNMRQELDQELINRGIYSMDIRNREVKNKEWDGTYITVIRQYSASQGEEYFISAESEDLRTLYGFVRLRLDHAQNKPFPELNNATALIREVHVYGDLTRPGLQGSHVQHRGIGRALMKRAEELALEHKYNNAAVIAAEGNKEYYRKLGYTDSGYYMIKPL